MASKMAIVLLLNSDIIWSVKTDALFTVNFLEGLNTRLEYSLLTIFGLVTILPILAREIAV